MILEVFFDPITRLEGERPNKRKRSLWQNPDVRFTSGVIHIFRLVLPSSSFSGNRRAKFPKLFEKKAPGSLLPRVVRLKTALSAGRTVCSRIWMLPNGWARGLRCDPGIHVVLNFSSAQRTAVNAHVIYDSRKILTIDTIAANLQSIRRDRNRAGLCPAAYLHAVHIKIAV
jgi:hypothetical protein